ncbi:DYW family of nucleic acid deaminases domain-containing protein [Trichoderma austrokoningii]
MAPTKPCNVCAGERGFEPLTLQKTPRTIAKSGMNGLVESTRSIRKSLTRETRSVRQSVRELSDDDDHSCGQASVPRRQGFACIAVTEGGTIISMKANFEVPRQTKTIGILFRSDLNDTSPAFPPVAAMSGFSHEPDSELKVQIAGRKWTNEAMYLCWITGHLPLYSEEYDHGIPGRFYACHAEKQLVAYFVNKHMFLPCDVDEDFGMSALSMDDLRDDVRRQKVKKLMGIEPPQSLKSATILMSRAVCDDCRAFARLVNEEFGLDIEVRVRIE